MLRLLESVCGESRPLRLEGGTRKPTVEILQGGCLPYGDISACFDSLSHDILLSTLAEHIHDGRFLRLIRELLKAGYLEIGNWNRTLSGAPQGSIIGPILSNIYLNKLDTFVEEQLIPAHTRGERRRPTCVFDVSTLLFNENGNREKLRKSNQT